MSIFTFFTYLFITMETPGNRVVFFRTNSTPFHHRGHQLYFFTCNALVQFKETNKSNICWEGFDALIGNPVFSSTLRTLDLSPCIVYETIQTRLLTVCVMTRKLLRIPVPVQTDGARQQLLQLLPCRRHLLVSL